MKNLPFGKLSDLTKQRLKNFWAIKRSRYSLLFLSLAYFLSLGAPIWIGDKPLVMSYEDKIFFPVLFFYADVDFGGQYKTEADYVKLRKTVAEDQGAWMLLPLVPHDPLHSYLDREGTPPYAPSKVHWLGTDTQGRDLLARLVYGFRICMSFALVLTFLGTVLGSLVGGIQGYLGGKFDLWVQRFIEIWSALPFLYVVILLGAMLGRSFALLVGVMMLFNWIGLSYYMRGEFLRLKNRTFVQSAKALGMPHRHLFFKEILPNSLTPVITLAPFALIGGIGSLTALDFLGFGLQPPTPSWGELLDQGLQNLYAWWISFFTVLSLFITLLLTTFVGEGVREAFDPKGERV